MDTEEIKLSPVEILKLFGLGKLDNYWVYNKKGTPYQTKENLTDNIIQEHIRGKIILGSSPFIDDIYVQYGLIDVDAHLEDNMTEGQKKKVVKDAEEDSKKLNTYFVKNNYPVYVNASGGDIGKHIRLYGQKILAKDMRAFLYKVCLEVLGHRKHEVFPKQNDLNKDRLYGNQAKVLLGVHPKSGKRTDLIVDGKQLDILKSLKFLNNLFNNFNSYKKIEVTEEDYKLVESVDVADISGLDTDVPEYCGFIEKVASKKLLTSGEKQKHPNVDPNIAAYTHGRKDKQEVREGYMKAQSRNHTALDNWKHKWLEGKPQFSCGQIISYLINRKDDDDNCAEGLEVCRNCPKYKKYLDDSINVMEETTPEFIEKKEEEEKEKEKTKEKTQVKNAATKLKELRELYNKLRRLQMS